MYNIQTNPLICTGPKNKMLAYRATSQLELSTMDEGDPVFKRNLINKGTLTNGESSKHPETGRQRSIHSVQQFTFALIRLATFDFWPKSFIDKIKLANSGFVCMRSGDLTQCFFCKGIVGFWENGDDPFKEHKKHFPNCPLVQGLETSNIPIVQELDASNIPLVKEPEASIIPVEQDENTLYSFMEEYLQFSLEHQKPCVPKMKYQTDTAVMNPSCAAYISYSSYDSRLQSFGNWPTNSRIPTADQVARAGFFYSGTSDCVFCFYCGGGLFNWNSSDDPMEDHLIYYEFCSFIRMEVLTSKAGVNKYHHSSKSHESSRPILPFRPKKISSKEEDLLLHYSFSKRLLSMGLTSISIKKALSEFLQTFNYLPGSLMSCIEVIIDWEDEQNKKNSKLIIVDETMLKSKLEETSIVTELLSKFSSSDAERKFKLVKEVNTLKEAIEFEKTVYKCRKCAERSVEVLFLPCNHFHLCRHCSADCDKCPSCGTNIKGTIFPIVTK